jgi:hypothetical protein
MPIAEFPKLEKEAGKWQSGHQRVLPESRVVVWMLPSDWERSDSLIWWNYNRRTHFPAYFNDVLQLTRPE